MQKNFTYVSACSLVVWTLAAAIAGCGPNEEEIRAKKAQDDQKMYDAFAKEEKLQKTKSNHVLVKLTDKQLYKLLDDCQQEITAFTARVFDGKSVGLPELVTEHSQAIDQAHAYVSTKMRLESDKDRIKDFKSNSTADLASGLETLDTSYPVLVMEDSFSGPQPRVIYYRCGFVDGLKVRVTVG